jgi:beta-galactosidase
MLAAALTFAAATSLAAQAPLRRVVNLDRGWSYAARRAATPAALGDIAGWTPVDLPHTWNALDATDDVPGYRRDAGWYRRALDVSGSPADARLMLHFEGANTVADVWVNGARAGGHVGGYVGFDVDVTPLVHRDRPNEVMVRVSNATNPGLIPSNRNDYVIYGGLTRDVWLRVLPPTSLGRVTVRTPSVTAASATATVEVPVAVNAAGLTVEVVLRAPDGRVVGRVQRPAADTTRLTLPVVKAPRLWSPESPALYTVSVALKRGAALVDSTSERTGFRFYRFEPNGPFYLNGRRLLLRGTHRHEEAAGLGAALADSMHRADMAAIKEMGANFVRLGHYPQDPEVYRAADSLGLLLWDELPWSRGGLGDSTWMANTRRLLAEQIDQNRNHPSIVLWSMGNEVADVLDADDHSERTDPKAIEAFMAELSAIAHRMDPSRPTATRKFDAGFQAVDVYSPSIWAGWYGGQYRDYERSITAAHAKFPRLLHMEYGADALYGRHSETSNADVRADSGTAERVGKLVANAARDGDWSESYQTDLVDWHLTVSERLPWLTGTAQWAFRDFATPLRPENPIPYVNQKGLVTRDGLKKDAYYVYRARWTTSPKFAWIVSHTWTERSGPKGVAREVRVYSNCARVELSNNGTSLGTKARTAGDFPAEGLRWPVTFAAGSNLLVARCAGVDAPAEDGIAVNYSYDGFGKPDHIELREEWVGRDGWRVSAVVVDAGGKRVLDFAGRVYFAAGDGVALVDDRGTPTGTASIQAANGRAAIEVRGDIGWVEARTQDINGAHRRVELVVTPAHTPQE